MAICNACRYCEGFCAVFPAMERRRTFTDADLKYLANLCHNCRDCYYACQYAPPHEFDLNFPKILGALRQETYRESAWPASFAGLFARNGFWVSLITVLCVLAVLFFTFLLKGPSAVFASYHGENAFYRVIPYLMIVLPFSALGIYILTSLFKGVMRFWRETDAQMEDLLDLNAHIRAVWDVMRLKYLDGGGYGCNYPDDRFSMIRRWFHHFVFYGFTLCLASTTLAAVYHHIFHWNAPYPFFSWPVVLGTCGGVALIAGAGGLLYLKTQMDAAPAVPRAFSMDISFIILLLLTSITGLLLLLLRETSAMGILLVLHVGIVFGLFITLPYGKFVHAVYRYAALVRNAAEQMREDRLNR